MGTYILTALALLFIIALLLLYKIAGTNEFRGAYGEYLTCKMLHKNFQCRFIRNPIYINGKGESSEIDIIMIHKSGIYVIESKNYGGYIYGKQTDYKWTQVIQKKKSSFYNPVKQNEKHIKVLKQILMDDQIAFHSVIAMSERCNIKNVHVDDDIICNNRNKLAADIKKRIQVTPTALYDDDIERLEKTLREKAHFDRKTRKQHVRTLKAKYNK